MQNCGVRRLPLDFRDQYFGCEIELTGINRATAAKTLADLFGTRAEHSGGGYDAYRVKDLDGKEWKIVRDNSIHPECRRRSVLIGETYKVELNSPKLEYGEMEKLQEVVRSLRRAGGIVNDSCGMHVHVDASKHTPQSLKNVLSIMYSKEDILFAALKVNPARIDSYCQAVDEPILEEIRKLPSGASMDQLKDRWYRGRDGSDYHYHQSRYHALNLHSVFYHGTVEWRLFNSTLHAGEAKANIILAMAISAQGINQKYTQFRKTPIGDNPAFTFRTFLLRLGLIGPEYKNVRILGRCTEQVYLPYIRNGYKGTPPTLQDFYRLLQMQPEPEAQGLALSSELFITGTLNTFARHTNVDTQARIIAYDIRELGEQLMPLGMLVTLDAIYNRVIQNWKKGRRTWIFCDEFYILFRYEYSANFFYKLWKRIRKYNGLVTGLTQNVDELLRSDTARLMLANSEFLVMLNQSATDRAELAKLLNISDNKLGYVTNVPAGCGLIRCAGNIVPFTNSFPKNTKLYGLMTTKPDEVRKE